jgi:hypothetical protein
MKPPAIRQLNVIAQFPGRAIGHKVPPDRLETHLADLWRQGAKFCTVDGKLMKPPMGGGTT